MQSDAAFEAYFNQWAATFGKTFASEEERRRRMQVFKENIQKMQHKNADASSTYWMQPGPDADCTDEEFAHQGSGCNGGGTSGGSSGGRRR